MDLAVFETEDHREVDMIVSPYQFAEWMKDEEFVDRLDRSVPPENSISSIFLGAVRDTRIFVHSDPRDRLVRSLRLEQWAAESPENFKTYAEIIGANVEVVE